MNGLRLVGLVGEPPSIPRMFPERIIVKKSLCRRLKKLADRIICFSKACIKRKDFFLWKNFHGIWTHSQSPLSRPPLLVEVGGSVQSNAPLQTYLTERPSVWYEWRISERWRKTETYRDKDGKRKTRTRSGWRTIDSGENFQPFFLRDETGQLLVEPEGAKVDAPSTMSCICSPSDPIYYGKGPERAIANSTHRRRFTESSLTPGHAIYVLGPAKLR